MRTISKNTQRLISNLQNGKQLSAAQIRSTKIGVTDPASAIYRLRQKGLAVKFENGKYFL